MPPCLIAIDIDGTLLTSDGQVTPRTRKALHDAHDAGVEIVIATGRRHTYAMRVLRELQLCETNAVVSSNGTVLRTVGAHLLHRQHMPHATAHRLCHLAGPFRDALVFTFDNVGEDGEDRRGALLCESTHSLHTSIDSWMRANEPFIAHTDDLRQTFAPVLAADDDSTLQPGPIQAMLCGTVGRMQEAEALLMTDPTIAGVNQPLPPGCDIMLHRTAYPDRDLAILDILPAGCSKASALDHLARLRGCTLADVLAIGDNWNDLPMLDAAGSRILMGNAPAELRAMAQEHGWPIGPTNDQEGVAIAIEHVLASVPRPELLASQP